MRLDARTKSAEFLQEWAAKLGLPFIAVLRESQVYVRCIEKGLTLFDLPAMQVQADLAQWEPILQWLQPSLQPASRAAEETPRAAPAQGVLHRAQAGVAVTRAPLPMATTVNSPRRPSDAPPHVAPRQAGSASPMSRLLDALPIPRFLQRTP
jgi:chromosome partitioning protein